MGDTGGVGSSVGRLLAVRVGERVWGCWGVGVGATHLLLVQRVRTMPERIRKWAVLTSSNSGSSCPFTICRGVMGQLSPYTHGPHTPQIFSLTLSNLQELSWHNRSSSGYSSHQFILSTLKILCY